MKINKIRSKKAGIEIDKLIWLILGAIVLGVIIIGIIGIALGGSIKEVVNCMKNVFSGQKEKCVFYPKDADLNNNNANVNEGNTQTNTNTQSGTSGATPEPYKQQNFLVGGPEIQIKCVNHYLKISGSSYDKIKKEVSFTAASLNSDASCDIKCSAQSPTSFCSMSSLKEAYTVTFVCSDISQDFFTIKSCEATK